VNLHLAILQSAGWLVPPGQRAEWLAEWRAEVWYVRQRDSRQATGFCVGAFRDALWVRQNSPVKARSPLRPESPTKCPGLLGLMAAVCLFFALRLPGPRAVVGDLAPILRGGQLAPGLQAFPIPAMLTELVVALLLLAATTPLSLGECPTNRNRRRWVFMSGKIVLLVPIVFFGSLDLGAVIGIEIQGPCMLAGYLMAFRWALVDQRQRCPECLRLLTHPARIGRPSQRFLEWYGTEFACTMGHGLLYVPENPTVSFRTQRWLHLDRSWSVLFS